MKKNVLKHLAFALTLALITPMAAAPGNTAVTVSAKAAPKLNKTSLALKGLKDSEKLTVMNPVAKATYSWSSTNNKVAAVDYKGTITPVAKGTATIKCRIKYPGSKTQKILSCKVKVEIPVTGIKITNADLGKNNAHLIVAGEQYDFNFKYIPAKPSSRAYWFIENTDIASVSGLGVVTGKKPGITTLTIIAAPNRASVDKSIIKHAVNISVVDKPAKTAYVQNVDLKSAGELVITFSDPIDESTVIDLGTDKLKDTIRIYENDYTDDYKDDTVDPGELKASISEDKKVLTITPENTFSGSYDIRVTSNVKTTENIPLTVYDETLKLVDNTSPTYKGTTLDETGLVSVINFSEPVNIDNLQVLEVRAGNKEPEARTESELSDYNNYRLTKDKKSIRVDMSNIDSDDENKTITVVLSGIDDFAGNHSNPYQIAVSLRTDTTPKPQAKILSIKRTSYSELTVRYDRAIRDVGNANINGSYLSGYIDSEDKKIVHYTLSSSQRELRGNQNITIGYWDGYNVKVNDDSADRYRDVTVNFDVDTSKPYVTDSRLESYKDGSATRYRLVLVFNEKVSLPSTSGYLTATLYAANGNVSPNTKLYYTAEGSEKVVTLKFTGSQISTAGTYKITIPDGLVKDVYNNSNTVKDITVNQNGSGGQQLAAPARIEQSKTNPSEIILTFNNKLDRGSAEKVANYKVYGGTVKTVELMEQTDSKAVVKLTLVLGSIKYDASYPIAIDGVRGYNNSFGELSNYEVIIPLKENTPPTVKKAEYDKKNNMIEITFNEKVKGTPDFSVYQSNKIFNTSSQTSTSIIDDKVFISLSKDVDSPSKLRLEATSSTSITDLNGNEAILSTIPVKY